MATAMTTVEDRKSHRPAKRRALSPTSQQSSNVEALFAHPEREIKLPTGPVARVAAAPPEIVTNVQGSSAGAGSGEFHVYKASRRREYERLRLMDEENAKEKADEEFETKKDEWKRRDEEALNKNRAKREKAKLRKQKKKGESDERTEEKGRITSEVEKNGATKKSLGPAKVAIARTIKHGEEDEEVESGGTGEELAEPVGITIHDDD